MSRLAARAVLGVAWRIVRRRWAVFLLGLPLLAAADNLAFQYAGVANRVANLSPGSGGPAWLATMTAHEIIRMAVLAWMVCGLVLLEAPTVGGRASRILGAFGAGWRGLLTHGVVAAVPVTVFHGFPMLVLGTGGDIALAAGARSIVALGSMILIVGLAAVLAPLPAVAVAEGRGAARTLDLTEGARLAIGGLRLGFAVAIVLPLRLGSGFILTRFEPGLVTRGLAEYRAALCEVLWLVIAAVIYRQLARGADAGMAELFD